MKLLVSGLFAGILDALAAIIYYLAEGHSHPGRIFQFIASAILGRKSFSGGTPTVLLGLLFHLVIAFCFVAAFFAVAGRVRRLIAHPLLAAIGYGIIVWCIMNLIVVPLFLDRGKPDAATVIINMVILMATIGLPSAFGARWRYRA